MELNFTEYDNNNVEKVDYSKYWEKSSDIVKTEKKKKVSFNDILSNMNLVVGKNGVLQQMKHQPQYESNQPQYESNQQYDSNQSQYDSNQPQYDSNQPQPQQEQRYNKQNMRQSNLVQPLDPSVKQSFIYNKYFKDYVDSNKPEPEIKVPKTIEEYHQMVLEQRLKDIEERKRVAQIKSTKLMFTTNQGYQNNANPANINPANINVSKNRLRMMNFR